MNKLTSIDEIIDLWEMKSDLKDKKKEIINSWKEKVDTNMYNVLLDITSEIIFYSDEKVSMHFNEIFPRKSSINFEKNYCFFGRNREGLEVKLKEFDLKKSIYFPLRTEERPESSNTIFLNFYKSLGIPVSYAKVDKPNFWLKKKMEFERKTEEYKSRYIETKDESIIVEYQKYAQDNPELYQPNYIFFVDDFIGSGNSVKKFLEGLDEFYPLLEEVVLVILVLEISQDAIEILSELAKEKEINFLVIYYRMSNNIFHQLYSGHELDEILTRVKNFNLEFEIKENEYCINNISVSYVNSPNNNVPFIYFKSKKWEPLFNREPKTGFPKPSNNEIKNIFMNLGGS